MLVVKRNGGVMATSGCQKMPQSELTATCCLCMFVHSVYSGVLCCILRDLRVFYLWTVRSVRTSSGILLKLVGADARTCVFVEMSLCVHLLVYMCVTECLLLSGREAPTTPLVSCRSASQPLPLTLNPSRAHIFLSISAYLFQCFRLSPVGKVDFMHWRRKSRVKKRIKTERTSTQVLYWRKTKTIGSKNVFCERNRMYDQGLPI